MAKHSPYLHIAEPLLEEESLIIRRMFGCETFYLHGRLQLVLTGQNGEEPWKGALFPVEREFQADVMKEFPALSPHPVLGKWLYLPESHDEFERISAKIVQRITKNDLRLGTIAEKKTKKRLRRPIKRLARSSTR